MVLTRLSGKNET